MAGISILIPCYNSAKYLPELFEGIRAQTEPFDEVICYDDASSDDTVTVAERLGARVIKGDKNRGPAYARNRLIESCHSEWLHFHDSDDLIDPRFVEVTKRNINSGNVQFLCNTIVLDRIDRSINGGNIVYDALTKETDQIRYFLENTGYASMGVYNKKVLLSINGFREDLIGNEDPDLHVRLVNAGYSVLPVKEFLVTKLEHAGSLSHTRWLKCMQDRLICFESYREMLDNKYHLIIGNEAARLSNYFYREGDKEYSKRARKLAFRCGLTSLDFSSSSKTISKVFGIKFYMWLYRRRVDLKLI